MLKRFSFAVLVGMVSLSSISCGDDSPTAPTPTPVAPTRVIALAGNMGFGSVQVGQSATTTLQISNRGNAILTITGLTVAGLAGSTNPYASTFTTGTIAAGATQEAVIRFTPVADQPYNGVLTVNGDQTSGTNQIGISGTGALPLATVAGVIADSSSGAPVRGAIVRVNDGPYVGRQSITDGNGYFSIPGVSGRFTLVIIIEGYQMLTRVVDVNGDTSVTVTITRAGTPAPGGGIRVGAICNNGQRSTATGSGACSQNGGVRCWLYSDGSCRDN